MSTLAWTLFIAVTFAALLAHALVMRATHRRALARQLAKHQQQQQMAIGQVEQTRKQIAQLQSDLATARRELREMNKKGTVAPVRPDTAAVRKTLEREFDEASHSERALPPDGFADTQPLLDAMEHDSLLMQ